MLETFLHYSQGYVALPVVDALRRGGVFRRLEEHGAQTLAQLATSTRANDGHLGVALRLVEGLGWLERDANDAFRLTTASNQLISIPDDIASLIQLPLERYFRGQPVAITLHAELTKWLDLSANRWQTADRQLADWLDGLIVLPALVSANRLRLFEADPLDRGLDALDANARADLARLLIDRGWATRDPLRLTEFGRHLVERALVIAVGASYAPMLRNLDALLFGDAARVIEGHASGDEQHVDRALNVVASGFQHERYFKDVDEMIVEIFDRQPLDRQPRYVADMGCGDGAFLQRIFTVIRERTDRGRHLATHPVTLIAADFSDRALGEARARLGGVPCLFVHGDIGNPAALIESLRAHGVDDPGSILHVRSFLDHDRTLAQQFDRARADQRRLSSDAGCFADMAGASVAPSRVIQDLVEHLQRWSSVVGPAGLVVLEVHSLPAPVVHEHLEHCENLYFDALQGFSGQLLVPAATFLMSAAEAGLFPRSQHSRRYPATLPFTRITLSWFERRDWRVRHATVDDIPALVTLEERAVEPELRATEEEIRRRVLEMPEGQCVLDVDGHVAGVASTQRIASPNALYGRTVDNLAALHDPAGRFVQLIALRVDPVVQQRELGDQFLDFVLLWLGLQSPIDAVVGVSRCRDFKSQSLPLDEYVGSRGADGLALDPILRFHQQHGARIEGLVPGFYPRDLANDGAGVMIRYDLGGSMSAPPTSTSDDLASTAPRVRVDAAVESCVRRVLGPRREQRFDPARPLMELGMDSLDLMELRVQLAKTLVVDLEETFFFEYPTCNAVIARLSGDAKTSRETHAVVDRVQTETETTKPQAIAIASNEPIAIVGMAMRLPGGITDPESCWTFLRDGRNAVGEPSTDRQKRWQFPEVASFFDEYPWIRRGGFLDDVESFDAPFFNLAPREASLVDPQQRLLLEVAWEALEHAAIDPQQLAATRSGVFTGIFAHDYELLQLRAQPQSYFDAYSSTGTSPAVAAGRIAYCLGLEGPAITVDTACSSSLVATHLACQSLRSGECDLALAAAANLMLAPDLSIIFAKAGMLAHDGHCKTFAADADGYVRGEGGAVVVLKRLSDAVAAGDRIMAVIRGSAINQDGASNGLTAPSVRAQEQVVRAALQNAGVDPSDVEYIEAHGTGTSLGDPIEVEALGRVFGNRERPLRIGSIKTNVGHLEAAAGMAGLIKTTLCLQHGELTPHLHFTAPNPLIPWSDLPIEVATARTPMGEHRIAGISAFGFSGTNAHVILESWREDPAPAPVDRRPQVLALSAKTAPALRATVARMRDCLESNRSSSFADVCYTATAGRAQFDHRLAITAESADDAIAQLSAWIDRGVATSSVSRAPRIAFLFTGQGAQYFGMGRELFATEPVFRRAIEACASILDPLIGVPLIQVLGYELGGDPKLINQTRYTQPALFALEYALAELWRSWGITPDAVMGHSVGEYVAACVAGVFTLRDALTLLATRSRLMQALPAGGAMAAVMADRATVDRARARFGDRVSIAAINGPANTVVSGDSAAVTELCEQLTRDGVTSTPLTVSHAFHSALMDPVLAEFEAAARQVTFSTPTIPLFSNLTGAQAGEELCDPAYWSRHLRAPVQFAAGVQAAFADGARVFLEIGPRPVLIGMARRCVDAESATWLPSIDGGGHDGKRMRQTVADLFTRGARIDWRGCYAGQQPRKVTLPTYPFERESVWFESRQSQPAAVRRERGSHPLLGARVRTISRDAEYAVTIDSETFADHRVGTQTLFPAAGHVELALAAARERFGDRDVAIESLSLRRPLWIRPDAVPDVHVVVRSGADGACEFEVHRLGATDADASELVAKARLVPSSAVLQPLSLSAVLERCSDTQSANDFYRACETRGFNYGSQFQVLSEVRKGSGEAIGKVVLDAGASAQGYHFDPVMLDGCLQVALATLPQGGRLFVPSSIERIRVSPASGNLWSHAVRREESATGTITVDIRVVDERGQSVAVIEGLVFKAGDKMLRGSSSAVTDLLYDVEWIEQAIDHAPSRVPWLDDLRERLTAALNDEAHGSQASLARVLQERSIVHARKALQQLGDAPVAARHREVFARIREIAAMQPEGVAESLSGSAELDLLDRCGESLAQVLRGERDALPLIFPGSDSKSAERLYGESSSFRPINAVLAKAIAELSSAANGAGLRILEVGGGTGATTAHVLPLLPTPTREYLFTDVSPRFTTEARQRFAAYPYFRAERLDIEQDPESQGVAPASYDVVIAANVLHATRDLRRTLAHARMMVRPGGQVVLLEGTAPRAWIDLTFGLLDGWWKFEDRSLRAHSPLLNAGAWRALLLAEGFDRVETLEPSVDQAHLGFPQAVIVARRAVAAPQSAGHWLVCGGADGIGHRVASLLREEGKTVTWIAADTTCRDFDRLVAGIGGRIEGAVDCRPADLATEADAATAAHADRGGAHTWHVVLSVAQSLASVDCHQLCVVTRGASTARERVSTAGLAQSTITGLRKVIALEHPSLHCRQIDLDPDQDAVAQAAMLVQELHVTSGEDEVAFRAGDRLVARLRARRDRTAIDPTAPLRLERGAATTLDHLTLTAITRRAPGAGEVEIDVRASGLNFLDVLDAMGVLPFARPEGLGLECAGVVTRVGAGVTSCVPGDAVVAIAGGALSRYVIARAELTAPRPNGLTDAVAAATPIAFLTAAYALRTIGRLQPGQHVLIHAAAGGTGMAAVQTAHAAGAEVLATASPSKWNVLRAMGVKHIASSRTLDFVDMVRQVTNGRGVDVVLNSIAGAAIEASLACVADEGHFIELGKTQILSEEQAAARRPRVRYTAIDLREPLFADPQRVSATFQEVIGEINRGTLQPLPLEIFPVDRAAEAFRFMQQARHVGKIAIEWPRAVTPLRRDATYLITGGTGGLGLRVAEWMAGQGAGRIVLMARSAPAQSIEAELAKIRAAGAVVDVVRGDASSEADLSRTIAAITRHSSLRGVIHAAGTLDDGVLVEQRADRFERVMAAKVSGSWLLHQLTKTLDLDFFVLFSSTASVFGSAGQGNHAAANAYLDALAHYRRRVGLPGLSINWGAWGEIGAAASAPVRDFMRSYGLVAFAPEHGLGALDRALNHQQRAQVVVAAVDWPAFFARRQASAFFPQQSQRAHIDRTPVSVLAALRDAAPADRDGLMREFLRAEIARVLGIARTDRIGFDRGFFELGMDSLTSVEFRNNLQAALQCRLAETVAFDCPTIDALTPHLLAILSLDRDAHSPASADTITSPSTSPLDGELDRIQHLSTEEAVRQLERELAALE